MTSTPVKFDQPPVNEVACSVLFTTSKPLKSTITGLYWLQIRDDFPDVQEAAPIPPAIEPVVLGIQQPSIQLMHMPDMRRSWFINRDGNKLIQIQEDRFLFNWRKTPTNADYPSYSNVITEFEHRLDEFKTFIKRENSSDLVYRQFELVYVNHITPENGLDTVGKTHVLVDHIPDGSRDRFLPDPQAFKWDTTYALPNQWGRLHVSAGMALRPPSPEFILNLTLTARGVPPNLQETSLRAWFDMAHEWITHGFADLTTPILHESTWKRTS